jgi:hypothetical protein
MRTFGLALCVLALSVGCKEDSPTKNGVDAVDIVDLVEGETAADVLEEPDLAPEIVPDVTNQANLFPRNPEKDEWELTTVVLKNIGSADGTLSGPYVQAFNCLNQDGGWSKEYEVPLLGMAKVQLCNIKQTITPDEDGSYLSVSVPEDIMDPDDSFAELMMFYHVNFIHDYYKEIHGYDGMDFPLEAYVNLMGYLEVENNVFELPEGWVTFDNAMFMPGESFAQLEEMGEMLLKEYLGIEDTLNIPFKEDAILFMQGESLDFAYDADVIYHEYTHAVVGGDRIWAVRIDESGPDASPRALNEAMADYFACSVMGDPIMAEFALVNLGAGRDLTEYKGCPANYHGEEHLDGLMYSSALWEIREALGTVDADAIIFNALMTFTIATGFEEAASATIAEAALLDPPQDAAVQAIFADHGLLGCDSRVRPWADNDGSRPPEFLPGTQTTGIAGFSAGAPGYLQHTIEVPEGADFFHLEVQAETSGMLSILGDFMGGSEVSLALALKHDGPISYSYDPEYAHDETAMIPLTKLDEGLFAVDVAGDCLTAGSHTLQFVNLTGDAVMVRKAALSFPKGEVPEVANYLCQEVVDPCADIDCPQLCQLDGDCEEGQVCVFTVDGCCSSCILPE